MAIHALRRWVIPGLTVLMLGFTPDLAWPQAWSVQVNVPTEFNITVGNEGEFQVVKGEDIGGMMIAVGTPYHIGFGFDGYQGTFTVGGDDGGGGGPSSVSLSVQMLNVFVDIPVPLVAFSLGTGWGTGTFDPDGSSGVKSDGTVVKSSLSTLNLWQFYAQLGIPLPWGLDLQLGYREFRGRFKSSETRTLAGTSTYDSMTLTMIGRTSSLGVRYTF